MFKLRGVQVLSHVITVYRESSTRIINFYAIHSRSIGVDISKPVKPVFLLPQQNEEKQMPAEATPTKVATSQLHGEAAERSLDLGIQCKKRCTWELSAICHDNQSGHMVFVYISSAG